MKKQNVRTISLIVCIFTFLLVGAAIFDSLESDYEAEDLRRLNTVKAHFIGKYNITDEDFKNMTHLIKHLIPHNARQWKFAGAFYYSVTVMTTIGYGHSTPRTWGGKGFTMLYAFLGIPLGLVMFQSIGERLNVFATFILANIKKCFRFKSADVSQTNLIVIDFTLAMLVVFISAAVFDHYESWGYWNAVYYCIITLTTIGFGDLVPLQTGESDLETRPEYVVFTLIFILFGLTVVSANMNLMVLRFMTANAEDDRRDEMEAAVAALTAVKVEGDIIYGSELKPFFRGSGIDLTKSPERWLGGGLADNLSSENLSGFTKPSNTMDSISKMGDTTRETKTRLSSMAPSASITTLLVGAPDSTTVANGALPNSNKPPPANEAKKEKGRKSKEKRESKDSIKPASHIRRRPNSMTAGLIEQDKAVKPVAKGGKRAASLITKLPSPIPEAANTTTSASALSLSAEGAKLSSVAPNTAEERKEAVKPLPPLPSDLPPVTTEPLPAPPLADDSGPLEPSVGSSAVTNSSRNVEAIDKCTPSLGQCKVPNCRHQSYCRDGLARNPADACSCPCHEEKDWWSYLLKTMPYGSANQPASSIKPPEEPRPPYQRRYQQQSNPAPPRLPHYMISNATNNFLLRSFSGKGESERLPLIPPPNRSLSLTVPVLPPKSSPLLTEKINRKSLIETHPKHDDFIALLPKNDHNQSKDLPTPSKPAGVSRENSKDSLMNPSSPSNKHQQLSQEQEKRISLMKNPSALVNQTRLASVSSDTTVVTADPQEIAVNNNNSNIITVTHQNPSITTILTSPAVNL